MFEIVAVALTSLSVLAIAFSAFLLAECIAAALASRRGYEPSRILETSGPVAVVVPAHNEAASIARTVLGILTQLRVNDRLVVVADNCTDGTAGIATSLGTEMLVRNNMELRGKGYAIQYAIDHLALNPPAVVLIIDADCKLTPGSIQSLRDAVLCSGRPAQARNQVLISSNANLFERVSAFAFVVKNWIRPLGITYLRGPCLLTGTGMAFPWQLAVSNSWASGDLVEDMDLTVRLATMGHFAAYVPTAQVNSDNPPTRSDSMTQRTRWEHGHLQTILKSVPRIARQFLRTPNWKLFLLAWEISVPPLSLLAMTIGLLFSLSTAWALAVNATLPLLLASSALITLTSVVLIAWWLAGRTVISFPQLLYAPLYAFAKIPVYAMFVLKPQKEWVRTGRSPNLTNTAPPSIPAPHIVEVAAPTPTGIMLQK